VDKAKAHIHKAKAREHRERVRRHAQGREVGRRDDADDVRDVERRERDLVELRREVEHDRVTASPREVDRLLHRGDAHELGLFRRWRPGEYAHSALVVGEVVGEVILGHTGDVAAREFDDRRARTQVEEHRRVSEL